MTVYTHPRASTGEAEAGRMQSSPSHLSDFFKVVKMTAHEERGGSHDEVQHLARQDGHKGVLPLQGMQVGHEALSQERQQGPV